MKYDALNSDPADIRHAEQPDEPTCRTCGCNIEPGERLCVACEFESAREYCPPEPRTRWTPEGEPI